MTMWTALALALALVVAIGAEAEPAERTTDWYQKSFFLLHEDHHTAGSREVGRDADLEETRRLVKLCRPDVLQIHAKGNPGWTTYPSKIGHTPAKLVRDVLAIYRDTARREGCHFSVYYNLGRDAEIMRRHPEWNRSTSDGHEYDRALCYHSGVAEEYMWPMIREVMHNYHPDGWWFDGSCFTVRPCYCDKCRERFRREHNQEAPVNRDGAAWTAYQEMQRQIYRECIRETARVIHEIDPNCLVSVNWAYSLRMPEKPDPGIAYLTGDIGNHVEGLSAEAHWYDGVGLPFDLMTQLNTLGRVEATGGDATRLKFAPKPACQLEQEMAVVVANGGRFWVWDTPTPTSGLTPERFEYMAKVVTPFLRARQPWCLGSRRLPDASLLLSAAAHYATTDAKGWTFSRRDNRIEGATARLPRLHLNYEMLGDWRLEKQDVRSPLLIVEHPKRLLPETVSALIRYVEGGGTLLLTGMGHMLDPRLAKVIGFSEPWTRSAAEPLVFSHGEQESSFDHHLYRLKTTTAEAVLHVVDAQGERCPVLLRNNYGKGQAWYAALPLLSNHGKNVVPDELLDAVFERVAPKAGRRLVVDAPETVEVVLRSQGEASVVHLVNMAPGQREEFTQDKRKFVRIAELPPVETAHVSVRMPTRPTSVELQPQGTALADWKYRAGRVEIDVPQFAVHQMVVIVP